MFTIDKETEEIMMQMFIAKQQFLGSSEISAELQELAGPQFFPSWGPNSVTFNAEPECCPCYILDEGSCDEMVEPRPTHRRQAKKPKRTLRDAIKESIRTSKSEQDESNQKSQTTKTDTDRKPTKKKVKNQGKAKTFKRKTKKPGRV